MAGCGSELKRGRSIKRWLKMICGILVLGHVVVTGIIVFQWAEPKQHILGAPLCGYVEFYVSETATGYICKETAKVWGMEPHPQTGLWMTPEKLVAEEPRMHPDPQDAIVRRYTAPRHPGDYRYDH